MPQPHTILFLGAGASRALGYPQTSEILPEVLRRLKDRTLFTAQEVVQGLPGEHQAVNTLGFHPNPMGVFEADLSALFPTLLDTPSPPNITDILSLFDHLIFTGNAALPGFSRERLARLRGLLERGIATVVSEPAARQTADQRVLVDQLVAWLLRDSPNAAGRWVTVVTTNYDLAVERPLVTRLKAAGGEVDYGFSWRDPYRQENAEDVVRVRPSKPAVSLFKLHGSINWVRCPHCDHVYVNEVEGPIFRLSFASRAQDATTCSCGYFPFGTLLVAPSVIRDVRDPSLLSIWQATLEAMRLAGRWVMIGYSLPPEDLAIRSMFLRASRGRKAPLHVDVFDLGDQPEIERRYRLLLKNVSYDGGGFETFIRSVG
jgi:hypothetical protein